MKFEIITIFPKIFKAYFNEAMLKRAQDKKIIKIKTHDLRDWTYDNHRTVDDAPYGGGAGMIMKIEPLFKALKDVKKFSAVDKLKNFFGHQPKSKTILLSAKGRPWTQDLAREYAKLDNLILICGRYEGVDERITEFIDEEISIGDYVMTGGELGAMVLVDSISRLLPGVLGNEQSSQDESHSQAGVLEYPQYTRPEVFKVGRKKYPVPEVLLSGNHAKIEEWRNQHKTLNK